MKFYSRNDILYVRLNGKRVSTKLKDTKANRKLVTSYYKNDEFFKKFDVNKNVPTVVALCEEVLLEKEETLKQASYKAYESLFRSRIKSYFKNRLVSEIKPKDIESWYKTFVDSSSIKTCDTILRLVFEKAILREYITSTPLIVRRPRIKSNYEMKPFSISEIELLLKNTDKWFRNFVGVGFFSGLRTGEILGLKWEDINFNDFTIKVNRTITIGLIQTPKTKSSLREIDMLPQCEEFLRKQREITGLGEYVFVTSKNTHFRSASCLTSKWKALLIKCDLEYRGIYQLRHSFASNMLSNKEDLLWVSAMLGHKSGNITLEKYTKFIRRRKERKRTFFDELNTELAQ